MLIFLMKSCRMVKIIKGGTHMKNTIYDYVDLRGDLSPIDFPYSSNSLRKLPPFISSCLTRSEESRVGKSVVLIV